MAERPQEQSPEWVAIEPSFRTCPLWRMLPDRLNPPCASWLSVREKFAGDAATNREIAAHGSTLSPGV